MLKKTGLLLLGFGIITGALRAQQQPVGDYEQGFRQDGNKVFFSTDNAAVQLEFCSPEILRVRTSWSGQFRENEPWMVIKYDWPEVTMEATEKEDHFLLETGKLTVKVNKSPFSIEIATPEGKVLSKEIALEGRDREGKVFDTATGPAAESPQPGAFLEGEAVYCSKRLFPGEHFFGFGERMDFLDRRGRKVRLNVGRGQGRPHIIGAYNVLEANYSPVPFFMSTRGYGIFLHNSYATEWDMGSTNPDSYTFGAAGGELDYYFIYGPDFPSILDRYTALTGKSPLLPRFGLGLHAGTYSGGTWGHEQLTSTRYVIDLVKKFRELGIPIDILHLDSTWRIFGKEGGKGATTFEWRPTFKNPEAMFDSLYAMHLNMVGLHIRPRFDNGKKMRLLDQAREKGYTYPENGKPGEFVNFFDPEAVDWWWENGVMKVASIGARFFKTDEGSAFGHKANESDKTGPSGEDAERLHNVFPLAYAKAPYEKFAEYNGMRGMNHTREGYAGIQRYPFIFAGDWPSEWQYLAPVIKAGLNIGLSGVGYWTHCMGGFEHAADPELYIRWCQFGLLSPVAHLFGMDHPGYKEPWNYGDTALAIFKKFDHLRYRLIPYLYTHAWQMYQTGMPLMRALVLEYQDDPNVYNIADQYLLGSSMMVCPVTEKGAQTRVVYLPDGIWFDYWTGKRYEGKRYLNVLTPLDQVPIFIKGGAVIPMQEPMDYVGEKPLDHLTLQVFPEGSSDFTLYDDDGKSLDYQKGEFAATKITCSAGEEKVSIRIDTPEGAYQVPERTYALKVHAEKAPAAISSGDRQLEMAGSLAALKEAPGKSGWYFEEESRCIYIQPGGSSSGVISVEIIR